MLEPHDAVANQMKGEEQEPGFAQAVSDLVIKNEMIREDLKATVLRILSTMIIGDRALRTVDDEAERWGGIPFENWPDKIKEEGVLVRYKYEGTRMRIPANHFKKVVNKIFVDAVASHYHKKAENFLQSARSCAQWILGGVAVAVAVVVAKKLNRL